jgi:transcriptional regulator with XRE-family HTH domain
LPHPTGDRFKRIAKENFNGKLSALAKALGMKPGSFSKYTSGQTMPGGNILKRLYQLDINLNWFLTGIGPMFRRDKEETSKITIEDSTLSEEMAEGFKKEEQSKEEKEKQKEAEQYVEKLYSGFKKENLNPAERQFLQEVKQFSLFLESRPLNPQVKRLLLELLIQSIDQATE